MIPEDIRTEADLQKFIDKLNELNRAGRKTGVVSGTLPSGEPYVVIPNDAPIWREMDEGDSDEKEVEP